MPRDWEYDQRKYIDWDFHPDQSRRYPNFESRVFTQENFISWRSQLEKALVHDSNEFCKAVEHVRKTNKKYRRYQLHHESREAVWAAIKFTHGSICSAKTAENETVLVLLTGLIAGQSGSDGVAKIGCPITEEDGRYKINFDRPCVVKVVHARGISNDQLVLSAKTWSTIYPHHPVAYHNRNCGEQYRKFYLVLPYISGMDLADFYYQHVFSMPFIETPRFIAVRGPNDGKFLNFRQKVKLGLAVVKAVKEFNDKQYIHGDLKIENMMVTRTADDNYYVSIVDLDYAQKKYSIKFGTHGTLVNFPPEFVKAQNEKSLLKLEDSYDTFFLGILLAALFVGFGRGEPGINYVGIVSSRIKASDRDRFAFFSFDKILPDTKFLDLDIWYSYYFSSCAKSKMEVELFYQPLVNAIFAMMHPDPKQRPPLTMVQTAFETALEAVAVLPFSSHGDAVTLPRVQAEPIYVPNGHRPAPLVSAF